MGGVKKIARKSDCKKYEERMAKVKRRSEL